MTFRRPGRAVDVEIRRTGEPSTESSHIDRIIWTGLRAFRAGTAVFADQTTAAVRIKASGQLNGQVDSLSATASQPVRVRASDGTWTYCRKHKSGVDIPLACARHHSRRRSVDRRSRTAREPHRQGCNHRVGGMVRCQCPDMLRCHRPPHVLRRHAHTRCALRARQPHMAEWKARRRVR